MIHMRYPDPYDIWGRIVGLKLLPCLESKCYPCRGLKGVYMLDNLRPSSGWKLNRRHSL